MDNEVGLEKQQSGAGAIFSRSKLFVWLMVLVLHFTTDVSSNTDI